MSNVTITRPKCRIRGCPRPIRTRKLGLCNMHRARFLRTGKVGPAGEVQGSQSKSERSRRKSKMGNDLVAIVRQHGPSFRIWWSSAGVYEIRDAENKHAAKPYSIPLVLSLERRGWIRIDRKDSLVKVSRVTAKGQAVIDELDGKKR